jgi:peptidoglycan/LPS O-acetylase OafA/YrhL
VRYSPQLDGLRAIAIFAVLARHLFESHFRGGWVGVDIFFVLSGFLITSILINEQATTGTISLKNFYGRRALRLLPALLVCIALTGALTFAGLTSFKNSAEFAQAAIPALFYFSNFTTADMGVLVHTWSLSVEEQFYLAWPVILGGVVLALKPNRRIVLLIALIVCFAAIRFYLDYQNYPSWYLYTRFHTRADELMAGALIACFASAWPEKVLSWSKISRLPALLGVAFLAYIFWRVETDQRWLYQWGLVAIAISCAFIVFSTQFDAQGPLARLLKSEPLVWIGKRSYGIYVYHVPVIWVIGHLIQFPSGRSGIVIGLVAKVATTLLLSWASYRWIETPALALKDKFFSTKPSQTKLRPAPAIVS